ncbi:AraC family transcriptional regulator [Microbulbifer sp. SAOS-129_SWC]|uniref:AraC family transcriptional regulator n=1 Tax=Microbulbifer sp. SAOS-129_SWC TaxID=3145235 RepID=UPI003216A2D0
MADYSQQLQRVLHFIDAHLQEPLSVEQLSAVAHLSRYHFHRLFSAHCGHTLFDTITALRMKRASYQLAFRRRQRIVDIALDNGYDSAEAFSRAFVRRFGQTPSAFRRAPDWGAWHRELQTLNDLRRKIMPSEITTDAVEIIEFPGIELAVLEHCGDPATLGASIQRFIEWRRDNGVLPDRSRTFNIAYNDPGTTPAAKFRFDLGVEIRGPLAPNAQGLVAKSIPPGRCARLRHVGGDDTFGASVEYLYRHWLSGSSEELRDFPLFFERVRFYPEVPESERITDIYLPLRSR